MGTLFVMTIDPSQSTTPFASITDVSYYKDKEDAVLFAMHTMFRIADITLMEIGQHSLPSNYPYLRAYRNNLANVKKKL